MSTVAIESIKKRYGTVEVLRSLSLEIREGEFLTLVGPSGCGKSTLLSLIAGLEEPTDGKIQIAGRVVNGLSPRERDIAMVFQSYALYPHMTVEQNLAFPLRMANEKRDVIKERVKHAADLLGIGHLLSRRPRELSGGQRQRVAIGRAIVRRPKVFLFDEPLSNLDAALRAQMRVEIKKLHDAMNATFIYVTHDQAEAMTLSDRIAVINQGVLEQIGSPRDIYDRPANVFVATFFGSPTINLVLPEAVGFQAPGKRIGIRPEHVQIGAGPAPSDAQPCTVYVTEPMGPETWVTVERMGQRLVGRASADFSARPGEPAWMRIPSQHLSFDAVSGLRA